MKRSKRIGSTLREKIFDRFGWKCAYCGYSPVKNKTLSAPIKSYWLLGVDHINPTGGNYDSNLVCACNVCNSHLCGLSFNSFEEKKKYFNQYIFCKKKYEKLKQSTLVIKSPNSKKAEHL